MNLPAGQQRILDGIEEGLRRHDSRLASMFATFTRLTKHEEMPEVERLKPPRRSPFSRTRPRTRRQRNSRAQRDTVGQGAGERVGSGGNRSAGPRPGGRSGQWSSGGTADADPGWWNRRLQWIALIPIAVLAVLSAIVVGILVTANGNQCGTHTPAYGAATASHAYRCPVRQVPFGRG